MDILLDISVSEPVYRVVSQLCRLVWNSNPVCTFNNSSQSVKIITATSRSTLFLSPRQPVSLFFCYKVGTSIFFITNFFTL
jgi:hypothetical protein